MLRAVDGEATEAALLAVADVCVAGVPDRRVGELPWAWIVTAPGATVDTDELVARCRERLAPYAVPARFVMVNALPRNDVGKVLRKDLVEQAKAELGDEDDDGEGTS